MQDPNARSECNSHKYNGNVLVAVIVIIAVVVVLHKSIHHQQPIHKILNRFALFGRGS